jgi:hypothetical protein
MTFRIPQEWARTVQCEDAYDRSALVAIADVCDTKLGFTTFGDAKLTERSGLDPEVFWVARDHLIQAGLIRCVKRYRHDGTRASDLSVLAMGRSLEEIDTLIERVVAAHQDGKRGPRLEREPVASVAQEMASA